METPWERARKARHVKQEERLDRTPGGRKGVNSGRLWRFPRDGKLFDFLVEARDTEKGSYSISHDEFEQLTKQAYATPPGMLPCIQLDLRDLHLIVIRQADFESMQMRLAELEGIHGREA